MSPRTRTHKNAILQSLEQLILMSASAADAEIVGSDDPAVTADDALLMAEDSDHFPVTDLPEFPFPDGEFEFVLAASTGMLVDETEINEPFEGLVDDNEFAVMLSSEGELFEFLPGEEIPEFLLLPTEVDLAAASGIINGDGRAEVFLANFQQSSSADDLPSLPTTTASDSDPAAFSGVSESDGTGIEFLQDGSPAADDGTSSELQAPGPIFDDTAYQSAAATGDSVTATADTSGLPVGGGGDASSSGAVAVTIQGTDASEWISGTDGNDVIAAGGGDDEIYAPIGNNVIDGGDGDDRVIIYEGVRADYTLVSQANGVTILEGPGLNGGVVRMELVNVESIQFNDGRVQVESLTTSDGTSGGSPVITGSDAGEWIAGTSADDNINAGAGDDEIYASLGTNKINGGAGLDTLVVYEGVRADYVLSKAADGRIYLQGPGLNGQTVRNLLTDIELIRFNDGTVETADVDLLADAALLSIFS